MTVIAPEAVSVFTCVALRLSAGIIGGLVVGVSSLVIVTLVGLFLWCRRPRPEPSVRPQEVLQAEFSDENGDTADSLTRLRPLAVTFPAPALKNTVTRYPAPSPVAPLLPPSAGYDSPGYAGPFVPRNPQQSGPMPRRSNSRLVVHNGDYSGTGSRLPLGAADEKRRLAMRQRQRRLVEGQEQDFGPVTFDPENNGGLLPPYCSQVTLPLMTQNR